MRVANQLLIVCSFEARVRVELKWSNCPELFVSSQDSPTDGELYSIPSDLFHIGDAVVCRTHSRANLFPTRRCAQKGLPRRFRDRCSVVRRCPIVCKGLCSSGRYSLGRQNSSHEIDLVYQTCGGQ